MDFLYEQPMTAASEYLLGKPVEMKPEESEIKRVEHLPGSTFLSGQVKRRGRAHLYPQAVTHPPACTHQPAPARLHSSPHRASPVSGGAPFPRRPSGPGASTRTPARRAPSPLSPPPAVRPFGSS